MSTTAIRERPGVAQRWLPPLGDAAFASASRMNGPDDAAADTAFGYDVTWRNHTVAMTLISGFALILSNWLLRSYALTAISAAMFLTPVFLPADRTVRASLFMTGKVLVLGRAARARVIPLSLISSVQVVRVGRRAICALTLATGEIIAMPHS